jgi:hypothetical protein
VAVIRKKKSWEASAAICGRFDLIRCNPPVPISVDLDQIVDDRVVGCCIGSQEESSRQRARQRAPGSAMKHTWYVTFEVPRSNALAKRRHPQLSRTFETEAEARDFARAKFQNGLIVTAGTVNPHLPRRAIPSEEIPAWIESAPTQEELDREVANTKPR